MGILAIQALRKMRGGAQSQLILGEDGNLWVVKFQDNPQGCRILANELIASRLAAAIGLSVPETDIIEVTPWIVSGAGGMEYELGHGERRHYQPGIQFGSKFVGGLMPGQAVDYLPEMRLGQVQNLEEFAGILCLDKWTANADFRQAVFSRRARDSKYHANFIDQGFCFNVDWTFPNLPLRGVYGNNCVYAAITGWSSFEPWLSHIESFTPDQLWIIVKAVPPEWYERDSSALECLVDRLLVRRTKIRELIEDFRDSSHAPFPLWNSCSVLTSRPICRV